MPKNILTQILGGKNFNYTDLQNQWNEIKNKPKNSNYGFLGSIFGMDSKETNYSKSIFDKIAESDNSKNISAKDIQNLANREKAIGLNGESPVVILDSEDFENLYSSMRAEKINEARKNEDTNPYKYSDDFRTAQRSKDIELSYIINPGTKHMSESEAKDFVQARVENVKDKIIKYASQHPEDAKIQEYVKLLNKTNFMIKETAHNDTAAEADVTGGKKITLNHKRPDFYEDEKFTTAIILHELEHIRSGDEPNSKKEELTAQTYAMEITRKIYNTDNIYGDDEKFLKEFPERYDGLPENSPGYGGLPENIGIGIDGEINSVEKNENNYVIKSADKNKEYQVTISLDEKGVPNSAEEITKEKIRDKSIVTTRKISNYKSKTHSFYKIDSKDIEVVNNTQ